MVAATIAVSAHDGHTPTLPDDWSYRHVWDLPAEWFVPRDDLDRYPSILEHPSTAHIPERWRHYLQDVRLWWSLRGNIRRLFTALTPTAARTLGDEVARTFGGLPHPILSVHVRRGDNVTNPPDTINLLDSGYYARAAATAVACTPVRAIVVFTDDPDWCERHADDLGLRDLPRRVYHGQLRSKEHDPAYHTEPANEWVDMLLSAHCAAHVMSNSTYSWWGAFLSADPLPVYPSYWVGPQLRDAGFDPSPLFPPDWGIRVEGRPVTPDEPDTLGD